MQRLEVLARQLTAGKLAGEHVAAAKQRLKVHKGGLQLCAAAILGENASCDGLPWPLGLALKPC